MPNEDKENSENLKRDRKENRENRKEMRKSLSEDPRDFEHRIHNVKFGLLTTIAKQFLPGGYWSKNRHHSENTPETKHPVLHLTFDDGPSPGTTLALLDLLAKEEVTATFFFIGENVRRYPELVEAVAKAGHHIGNHSLDHPFFPRLSIAQMEKQIDTTNDEIESITGTKPKLFRPPYGLIDNRGARLLSERHMSTVYWGAVADDWQPLGAPVVVKRIMRQLPKEELIVLHEGLDIGAQNLEACRQVIHLTRDLGYRIDPI